jgi:hypothetical protein
MGKRKKTVQTSEPTSSAIQTPAQIYAEARKRTVNTAAFAKAQRRTDAAVRADTFEWNRSRSTVDGLPIHYFRVKEESIVGVICPPEYELWKGWTYKMVVQQIDIPGQSLQIFGAGNEILLRLPGNRLLNKVIEDAQCQYQRVKITYKGKRYKTGRHYEKVYAITAVPLAGVEILDTKAGRETLAQAAREAAKKPAPKAKDRSNPEAAKAIRRKYLKDMIAEGNHPSAKTLAEFKGESWADKAIAEAK